jgi:hypothetical protein
MLFTRNPYTADEAAALVGRDVRFATGVRTTGGLALRRGERGRVTGYRTLPDRALLVVRVHDIGDVIVGNAEALTID